MRNITPKQDSLCSLQPDTQGSHPSSTSSITIKTSLGRWRFTRTRIKKARGPAHIKGARGNCGPKTVVFTHLFSPLPEAEKGAQTRSTVRVILFDFPSPFDTIQPVCLTSKLSVIQVDQDVVHEQQINSQTGCNMLGFQDCLSDDVTSSTGRPWINSVT